MAPRTHLIIGDPHFKCNSKGKPDIARAHWLAKFIDDHRPDVIIDMGDWADMPSLCSYDKGTKSYEGRRYWKDVGAALAARDVVSNAIERSRGYSPLRECLVGNHENRIQRAIESDPAQLEGIIGLGDLYGPAKAQGWRVTDYLTPREIDGICYQHYFTSGVMARAISGKHAASNLVLHGNMSCVQGHTHTFDYSEQGQAQGNKVFGLVAGCYFTHQESYAGPANRLWWRGLVLLRNVVNGYGEIAKFNIETIRRTYG